VELWFEESTPEGWGLKVRLERTLESVQSQFQRIDLYQTSGMGKLLVIDGKVQLCELDEFTYHEMLAHVPLLCHPAPRRVMVVGGGDGGTMREVLAHPSVERAVLVEIDPEVVRVCREHLPTLSGRLGDPRVEIVAADAAEYMRTARDFDAILVDSSDPVGPSEVLFSGGFYSDLRQALTPQGVMAMQSGSPFFYLEQIVGAVRGLKEQFRHVRPLIVPVPTYPSGTWSLVAASLGEDLELGADELARRYRERGLQTRWYSPQMHRASLALPPFLEQAL
jgi:spermidine synthase